MKDLDFQKLVNQAHWAGMVAGKALKPTPMVVQEHANVLDDSSPVVQSWTVNSGVCGFAWVQTNEHGNSKFVKFLKAESGKGVLDGKKAYYGGYYVTWVSEFGQSMEQKEAYADAFAVVLQEAGLNCYSGSRMD